MNYRELARYRMFKRITGFRDDRPGQFPDGTVMVLEMQQAGAIEVSVKDSARFEGGWGFYDFDDGAGNLKPQADPLPQTAGCIGCHRDRAATDHVFTQFYPNLRSSVGSNGV